MRWQMQCGGVEKKAKGKGQGKERKGKASDNQTAATPKYIIDRGGSWEGEDGGGRQAAAALDAT